jgi:subtilisin family serine protease
MRKPVALLAAGILLASPLAIAGPATADPKPVLAAKKNPIAGQYTVVLDEGADVDAAIQRLAPGATVVRKYKSALRGFTVKVDANTAKKIAADAKVDVVQQDARVRVTDREIGVTATQSVPAPPNTYWGLHRIDQRTAPSNAAGNYNYFWTATKVTAYVIDTGIHYGHVDFGGRASLGVDLVGDGFAPVGGDCYGHGTHVAGTIGGKTYGVAKAVKLKSVRVLDCGGSASYSTVIAGLDWVAANGVKPAVVNLSLGGGADQATNIATNNLIEAGFTTVVSAGNNADDACFYSPASTLAAITVGATGDDLNTAAPISDVRSSYSNYGECVDIFAPGSQIKSAWIGSTTATNTIDGTSMAAPHVAGVAALYLAANNSALPVQVRNALVKLSTKDKVTSPGTGSPNRLLYSGGKASLSIDVTPEPVAQGTKVTAKGKLTLSGGGLGGRTVEIWFDKYGTTAPVKVGTATTSSTGAYSRAVTVNADGYWYAKFLSQPLIEYATSSSDYVSCSNC